MQEILISSASRHAYGKTIDWKKAAIRSRLEVALNLSVEIQFNWVLFSDADCVLMRNMDHLFVGKSDILIFRNGDSIDFGFFAVRGTIIEDFCRVIMEGGVSFLDSLGSIVSSKMFNVREFERGEVVSAADPDLGLSDLLDAAVIHLSGLDLAKKLRLAFALHMMSVYGDEDGLFFDMLES